MGAIVICLSKYGLGASKEAGATRGPFRSSAGAVLDGQKGRTHARVCARSETGAHVQPLAGCGPGSVNSDNHQSVCSAMRGPGGVRVSTARTLPEHCVKTRCARLWGHQCMPVPAMVKTVSGACVLSTQPLKTVPFHTQPMMSLWTATTMPAVQGAHAGEAGAAQRVIDSRCSGHTQRCRMITQTWLDGPASQPCVGCLSPLAGNINASCRHTVRQCVEARAGQRRARRGVVLRAAFMCAVRRLGGAK